MSVFGDEDSRTSRLPARRTAPMVERDLRHARSGTLAEGTLACPGCDAPLELPGPAAVSRPTSCPFCAHRGSLGSFISLRAPTRPTRVVIRVGWRSSALTPAHQSWHTGHQ